MARSAFFSFAYDDVKNFKVNVVRQSWLLNKANTFVDGSMWETEKTKGPNHVKKIIDEGLGRTSVTGVLIGDTTADRRWVKYEIVKSFERGNGIFGVHINRIRSKTGYISARGSNPLDRLAFEVSDDGKKINFFELINRTWYVFDDLPEVNNRKANTLHFKHSFWRGNEFGEFIKFSEKFPTYCWDYDLGHENLSDWIESAAQIAGR